MTKTVTIAATRTNGDPYAHHDVIVTLVAGSAGGVVGSNVIVEQSTVKLDANGEGSIVLETNEAITSPATSFYRFTVADSSPTITRSIALTDDLPSTVSWTLAEIQVGDPTIPQRDVSSDYVTIGGQSLTNYLADLGSGVAVRVDLPLSPPAVDGSATTTVLLSPNQNGVATGNIPDGWVAEASVSFVDLFTALGVSGSDPLTALVPGGEFVGLWSFTPDTVGEPWTPMTGEVAYILGDHIWMGALDGDAWRTVTDSTNIIYSGTGMFDTILDVHAALNQTEGALDRIAVVSGGCLTTNIDITATNPALEYGECVVGGKVFLNAQTDPAENGGYDVTGDLSLRAGGVPFDPPGNFYRIVFNLPGDPADGLTLAWLSDDTSLFSRAGKLTQTEAPGSPGRWITIFDPTATDGGVALGETSSTAYRGDRGKTAYDHSQVATGNPHGTTAADVGAAAASHTHAASAIASGTIDIARIPTGTTGSTVPFGNDARFSDTRTPTDASVTTAKLDATLTAALARIPQTVQLGSDQSVTSQQTLQNITGLSFAVTAGSTYYIDGLLYVTGATAADLRVGFTCPAGTVKVAVYGMTNIATAVDGNVTGSAVIQASGGEVSTLGTLTGTEQAVIVRGYFACTTNGTFQMQHAQRTSTGSATTVKAGSFITYHT